MQLGIFLIHHSRNGNVHECRYTKKNFRANTELSINILKRKRLHQAKSRSRAGFKRHTHAAYLACYSMYEVVAFPILKKRSKITQTMGKLGFHCNGEHAILRMNWMYVGEGNLSAICCFSFLFASSLHLQRLPYRISGHVMYWT